MNKETVREPHNVLNDRAITALTDYSNPSWANWQDIGAGYYRLAVAENIDLAWSEEKAKEKLASWASQIVQDEPVVARKGQVILMNEAMEELPR